MYYKVKVYSFYHGCEITYYFSCIRRLEKWTPDQLALANRITAVLVAIDAALVATALTLIYLFTR